MKNAGRIEKLMTWTFITLSYETRSWVRLSYETWDAHKVWIMSGVQGWQSGKEPAYFRYHIQYAAAYYVEVVIN